MKFSRTATPLASWIMAAMANAHAGGGHHHFHDARERELGEADHKRTCGTADPTLEELAHDQVRIEALKEKILGETIDGRRSLFITEQPVEIDTHVHIIHAADGTGNITDAVMNQQIRVLNEGFSTTSIQFKLIEINHVENDSWFALGQTLEAEYKNALHVGDSSTLNLYYTNLEEGDKSSLLGFATYPFWYGFEPMMDGVVNNYQTVPGGRCQGFDEGKTTIHEVGHWMGLSHTFNGGECDGPGDFVGDTAAHIWPTSGCPVGVQILDTCPGEGRDPVSNFMDYSDDICLTEFTPGQSERMYLHWLLYRQQDEACPAGTSLFELEVQLDRYAYETYWSLETTNGETILLSPECGTGYLKPLVGIYSKDICIPTDSYVFTFGDTFGDGLENGSGYTLTVQGEVVKEGGTAFKFSEVTNFDVNAGSRAPVTPQPTLAPVAPTPIPTAAPVAPVVTPPPGTTVEVAVFIAFDDFPYEIGWSLECGDQVLADVQNGTYVLDFNTTEVFVVSIGDECSFTLTDSLGDGLFCDQFICGYYSVSIDGIPVVPDSLFAGDVAIEKFVAEPVTEPPSSSPSASLAPTITAAPSGDVVAVSFEVTMDDYPEEIGIVFSCDETVFYQAAPGDFEGFIGQNIVSTFDVPRGSSCTFSITDSFGDGLFCFSIDNCAYYALFYGDDSTFAPDTIAGNQLFFDDEEIVTFIATGGGQPTLVPSLSPTAAPSTTSSPTIDGVAVWVAVVFDEYPEETGISLVCGGQTFIDLPAYSFGTSDILSTYQETVSVPTDSECTFLLTDLVDDGLCVRNSVCGSYELMVGGQVIQSGSEFTDVVEVRFLAGLGKTETVPSVPETPTAPAPTAVTAAPDSASLDENATEPTATPDSASLDENATEPTATPDSASLDEMDGPSSGLSCSLAFTIWIGTITLVLTF